MTTDNGILFESEDMMDFPDRNSRAGDSNEAFDRPLSKVNFCARVLVGLLLLGLGIYFGLKFMSSEVLAMLPSWGLFP